MDYEKMYNEALKRAKAAIDIAADKDLVKGVATTIFPELRESDDERIRKELIFFLKKEIPQCSIKEHADKLQEFVAYLEKQRESTWTEEDDEFERIILPRILNPDGWTLDQNNADKHYLQEFVARQKNKSIEKQKEQKPVEPNVICVRKMVDTYRSTEEYDEAGNRKGTPVNCMVRAYEQGIRDVLKVVKQKPEVNLVFPKFRVGDIIQHIPLEKWDRTHKIISIDKDGYRFDYSHLGDSVSGGFIGFSFEKEYELVEQKPAEKQDYSGLTDFERAIHRGFLCAGVENVPVTIIKETAQDCLAQIKPAEWSEEDKMHLNNAILAAEKEWGVESCTAKFLKSLRPQPKQEWSEEEKKKLNRIYEILGYAADDKGFLTSKRIIGDKEAIELQDFLKSLRPQQEQPEVNIWHDVKKEAPTNFGAEIIVLCKNKNKEDGIWLADLIQCFGGQYEPRVNWEDPVKWAYLSEILPQRD